MGGQITRLRKSDIVYLETERPRTIIHSSRITLYTYKPLDYYQGKLGESFLRCHRSYLINWMRVMEINSKEHKVILDLDGQRTAEVGLGREYKKNLMGQFNRLC
jgi:DNA-binding LytR/AlgR family response regulator